MYHRLPIQYAIREQCGRSGPVAVIRSGHLSNQPGNTALCLFHLQPGLGRRFFHAVGPSCRRINDSRNRSQVENRGKVDCGRAAYSTGWGPHDRRRVALVLRCLVLCSCGLADKLAYPSKPFRSSSVNAWLNNTANNRIFRVISNRKEPRVKLAVARLAKVKECRVFGQAA